MPTEHIVTSYAEELEQLTQMISEMGGKAEALLSDSVHALNRRDSVLAERVIEADRKIDEIDREVDHFVVRLLALRQPMAVDLRNIVCSLKISSDLERIGDYAKNIAKRTMALNQTNAVEPIRSVPRLSRMVGSMLHDVLDAFARDDVDKAIAVWERDNEVDSAYTGLFRELLTYMMEDPRTITACTHVVFVAKNIERIGDHTTNIAENVYYKATGENLADRRPNQDTSSFAVVEPDEGM